ncbi:MULTISPECIES: hypothetical protein [Paenibacillus]|nr:MULTISPECIES: hypothetical protein [Paenibacillus]
MLLRSMGATAKATVIRANAVEVTRSILKKRQRSEERFVTGTGS